MKNPRPDADPEQVLAHDAFVRGLARQLLRDSHGAEDLAQQTWVAALRRPPQGNEPATLRAWLAAVVRRLAGRRVRTERRTAAREQGAARSGQVPSTAEIVARENQRAEVVRAVLELEPIYRDVVLLRFFEHLPPRAIARRIEVPVETVRTRLKRAFALLRNRLDARQGGSRAAWAALLVPLAGPPAQLPAWCAGVKSALTGVLLMSSKTQITAMATALAGILVVAWWVAFAPDQVRGPGNAAPADQGQALTAKAMGAEAGVPAVAPEVGQGREQVQPEAAPETGSLVLQVVFDDDCTPAVDALVDVWRPGIDRLPGGPRTRTDAEGKARFDELRPGKVYPELWRGSAEYGTVVEITAGRVAEAVLRIAAGMNVRGRVVDGQRRPIAIAEVVTSDWGGGQGYVLAQTAADGTFALRAVNTHCHIGARARGFAASHLRQFTAGKGANVELEIVLEAAAVSLLGKVIDWRGLPVPGAVARAGHEEQNLQTLPDGGRAIAWRPEFVSSDEQGRFEFLYLPAGKVPLWVRAEGLAPWTSEVELTPGRVEMVTVTLVAGVTLVGTVKDRQGLPVARVDIMVGDGRVGRDVKSATDGTFRMEGLPVGELQLQARSDQHGDARRTVTAAAGETIRWDVVLDPGLTVKGRVLDVDGKPIAGVSIESRIDKPKVGERWMRLAHTDGEGRFLIKNCPPDRPVNLQLRRVSSFVEMTVKDVQPGGEEVVIRMPREAWVHIQGSITDPDGKPLQSVHISPSMKGVGGAPAETADPATGKFRYGPFPPGEYALQLRAEGFPTIQLPSRQLGPDEVWDVGALRFERGGSLVIVPIAQAGAVAVGIGFAAFDAEGKSAGRVQVSSGIGRLGPLPVGSYRLQVTGKGVAADTVPFTIQRGVETRLDVPLRAGVAVAIECRSPTEDEGVMVQVEISDASGVVAQLQAIARERVARTELGLLPGSYRVTATLGRLRGAGSFDVMVGADLAVKLDLRRE